MIRTASRHTISKRTASAKKVFSAMEVMLDYSRIDDEKTLGILGML